MFSKTLLARRIALALAALAFFSFASAQTNEWSGRNSLKLEQEIFALLRDNDVGEVAEQMAQAPPPREIWSLLIRLHIFIQAGHDARAQETLRQILDRPEITAPENWVAAKVIRENLPPNVVTQRLYIERFSDYNPDFIQGFYKLWRDSGETKGLQAWLEKCGDRCVGQRIDWSVRQGAADELFDQWEAEAAAASLSVEGLEVLLNRLAGAEYTAKTLNRPLKTPFQTRLARVFRSFQPQGAADYYALAEIMRPYDLSVTVDCFQKALSLPFTPAEERLFVGRYTRFAAIAPRVSDWGKVFRYSAKKQLAEIYQQTGRADAAQSLVQELVALGEDKDVSDYNTYQLAGQAQSSSGSRAVESKILRDEAKRQNFAAYWLERVSYYEGREEPEQVRHALRQALVKLPYRAKDKAANQARLGILSAFNWFVKNDCEESDEDCDNYEEKSRAACLQQKSNCSEVVSLLRREVISHQNDLWYAVGVLDILRIDLNDERDRVLTELPELLPRYFTSPETGDWGGKWSNNLIESVVTSKNLPLEFKKTFVARLERLALAKPSPRPLALALSVKTVFPQKTFALLQSCQAMGEACLGKDGSRNEVVNMLFDAYLAAKEWKAAEQLIFTEKIASPGVFYYYLGRLVAHTAWHGNTPEAMRLWRILNRYDRRHYYLVKELAYAPMKEKLREFYLEMKKKDPQSSIPDAALALL
jgi:hypothetical protein